MSEIIVKKRRGRPPKITANTVVKEENSLPGRRGKIRLSDLYPKRTFKEEPKEEIEEEINLPEEERQELGKEALKLSESNKKKAGGIHKRGFQKGNTYAKGRPPGTKVKFKTAAMIEKIGEENAMIAMEQMVEWMKGGCRDATRFLLERIYVVRRGQKRYLGYDGAVKTVQDINDISEHVVKMMADGDLSAEEAEEYMKVFERKLKIITDTEIVLKIQDTCLKVEMIKGNK